VVCRSHAVSPGWLVKLLRSSRDASISIPDTTIVNNGFPQFGHSPVVRQSGQEASDNQDGDLVSRRIDDGRVDCRRQGGFFGCLSRNDNQLMTFIRQFSALRGSAVCGAAFSLEGGSPAVAFDIHLQDRRMVNEAIDRGQCHGGVGKNLPLSPKG
jgi:hypothetical protein